MKKVAFLLSSLFIVGSMSSCKTAQPIEQTVVTGQSVKTSLEGEKVQTETLKMQGISMQDALNDEGTAIIQRPYKWFAGIGKLDNKQMAIELAQREAYATISRVLNNAVQDQAEKGSISVNEKVQQALTSYWEQFSQSLIKKCEPFGDVQIEYSPSSKSYTAIAKVGIRGDHYNQLLQTAGDFKPSELSEDELKSFIEANKAIMEAAKGN